jgi:signal transduction histidine kinase
LEKEASKVLALDAKNRAQRARLFRISLVTVFIIVLAAVWIWIVRNQRKQDAEQAFLKQQLLQKDKMATLGEMTAGVAHEIKNPLNFVNNFAEGSIDLLDDLQETLHGYLPRIPDDDREDVTFLLKELQQNARDIHEQGKRADAIINGMMNHARGESTESSLANINDLLMDSWELAMAGAGLKYPDLKVNLQKEIATDLPDIRVIPQDLNRVFLNIFNNSLEAFAERHTPNPRVDIQTTSQDSQIRIRIIDNAGGISKEIQDKVFNPFFTTKPTGKGNTGLGLSIVHDIIEKGHDGSISLQSDAAQTTEITIRLPEITR